MADSADGGSPTTPDEVALAPEAPSGPRRRHRALALWGVIAVLAVGAGALVVTSADDDDPPRLPIALGSQGGSRSESAASPAADMSMMAWVTYVAGDDLPLLGGSGPAYRLSGEVSEDQVRDLAAALGVTGEPTHADQTWTVDGDDGFVQVYEGNGGSWWYSPESANATSSSGGGVAGSSGSAVLCAPDDAAACEEIERREQEAISPDGGMPVTTTTMVAPANLPSEDEAREIALDLFRDVGVDVDDAHVTVDGPYDAWYVNIEPRVDGRAVTGLGAQVAVGDEGAILSAGGVLNDPEELGDYPVLDTRGAINRLNAQMGGYGYGGRELAVEDAAGVASEEPTTTLAMPECTTTTEATGTTTEACSSYGCAAATDTPAIAGAEGGEPVPTTHPTKTADVDPDTPVASDDVATDPAVGAATAPPSDVCPPFVPPEPVEVVLHEAEEVLVLMGSYDESGDAYLVPGYRMRGDDDAVVDVPSVDDESLLPQPEPEPEPLPVPEPGGIDTTDPGAARCAEIEPGPDGAVPDICLDPSSTPPAEPTEPAEDLAPPVEAP